MTNRPVLDAAWSSDDVLTLLLALDRARMFRHQSEQQSPSVDAETDELVMEALAFEALVDVRLGQRDLRDVLTGARTLNAVWDQRPPQTPVPS